MVVTDATLAFSMNNSQTAGLANTWNIYETMDLTTPDYSEYTSNTTDIYTTFTSISQPDEGRSLVEIIFIALVAVILMAATVVGNLLVIIAYRKNRRLRSVNNLFLVSLACSDLVIGIVSMTLYPVVIITEKWYLGEVACDIWLCIDYTMSMASVANLMLICLDRYFSVTRPFTYRRKRTRNKAKIVIVGAWIFSLLLWSPAIIIWPRVRERTVPNHSCYIQFFEDPLITSVTAILAFYLPVIVMIILYWRIYLETRRCHEYLEYLRSYSSKSGRRSPTSKRKSLAPAMSSIRNQFFPSRRRTMSSNSTNSKAVGDAAFCKPNSVTVNHGTKLPVDRATAVANSNTGRPAESPQTGPTSDRLSINEKTSKENYSTQPGCLDSSMVNNSLQSQRTLSNNNGAKAGEITEVSNGTQHGTIWSCTEGSQNLTLSTRTSWSNSSDPLDKDENCSLLVNEQHTTELRGGDTSQNDESAEKSTNFSSLSTRLPGGENEHLSPLLEEEVTNATGNSQKTISTTVQDRNIEQRNDTNSSRPTKVPSSERKAARTLSAILFAFVLTWLPYNVCVIYSSFCEVNNCEAKVPQPVWDFAYYLCYINSTVNPICYAMCNTTFRDTFRRLLTCSGRSQRHRTPWCCPRRNSRDRMETNTTVLQSTSSSPSSPPSPSLRKRESTST